MWLLPSRRRPESLQRFFAAYKATDATTPGRVLIDTQDLSDNAAAYAAIELPQDWLIITTTGESQGDKIREFWPHVRDAPWIGYLGDDCVPETPFWDAQLIDQLKGWNFLSCNDLWQAPQRVANCWVMSGELVRAIGYFWPPRLQHLYIDDIWETLGRETGCWQIAMGVTVRHVHVLKGEAPEDDTHRLAYSKSRWIEDQAVFAEWLAQEKPTAVARIRFLARRFGIGMFNPNFAGVNLLIATPTMSGEYEASFVWSLLKTFDLFREAKVNYKWLQELYNADICAARAKLLAGFLAMTEYTHLLLIDADMGWEKDAVLRLFAAQKDLVCVAGPKKCYPITFAANHTDDAGTPLPITNDLDSGAAECSHVGMAFSLVTRACAEKMVAAHPELEYETETGATVCAVYNPIVKKRRYYAEDYAFCERWRAIGGQVYVCPDVELSHTGKHTFKGRLSDTAPKPADGAATNVLLERVA